MVLKQLVARAISAVLPWLNVISEKFEVMTKNHLIYYL